MIVSDTSAVIDFLHGGKKTKSAVEESEGKADHVTVTTISIFKLLAPIFHRRLTREEPVVRRFLNRCELLQLDSASAEEASGIMGELLRMGKPVNAFDALIAGIAKSREAGLLVTRDEDFREIAKVVDIDILFLK